MQTNKAQTTYKASFPEENAVLDALWFECSDMVVVSVDDNGLLELSNVTDVDRQVIKKGLAAAGCDLIEIIEENQQDEMHDLLLKARNILHKREDLDAELVIVHDYLDIVLDNWKK